MDEVAPIQIKQDPMSLAGEGKDFVVRDALAVLCGLCHRNDIVA
jgi:hypothetical protein